MPELHKLTPILGVLQDDGYHVALVTDGRMSGASGKVPAAIHVTPECLAGGATGEGAHRRRDPARQQRGLLRGAGRRSRVGRANRAVVDLREYRHGLGRELFGVFRANALGAEQGAMSFVTPEDAESIPARSTAPVHDHFVFAKEPADERPGAHARSGR